MRRHVFGDVVELCRIFDMCRMQTPDGNEIIGVPDGKKSSANKDRKPASRPTLKPGGRVPLWSLA